MSLRRIYSVSPLRTGTATTLDGDAANHILRVLRLRVGDELVVFDGSGRDYAAQVTTLRKDAVTVAVGAGHDVAAESPLRVTLFQGVCRGPRMDTVIQKATELGVARIEPVLMERSVVRLGEENADRKRGHWQRVAIAAAEQCGRSEVPAVGEPRSFDAAIEDAGAHTTRWLLDPGGESLRAAAAAASPLALLIGPEGGLTAVEREIAATVGFRALKLGPRILRTETAPLAALAVLQFIAGDLG